jgi:hypothetical protein
MPVGFDGMAMNNAQEEQQWRGSHQPDERDWHGVD